MLIKQIILIFESSTYVCLNWQYICTIIFLGYIRKKSATFTSRRHLVNTPHVTIKRSFYYASRAVRKGAFRSRSTTSSAHPTLSISPWSLATDILRILGTFIMALPKMSWDKTNRGPAAFFRTLAPTSLMHDFWSNKIWKSLAGTHLFTYTTQTNKQTNTHTNTHIHTHKLIPMHAKLTHLHAYKSDTHTYTINDTYTYIWTLTQTISDTHAHIHAHTHTHTHTFYF